MIRSLSIWLTRNAIRLTAAIATATGSMSASLASGIAAARVKLA
jgi:hypothetical protein